MKKTLFVFACFTILTSCSVKTNEEKARELIEPEVKAHLIKPESYEFAQIQLDSCFTDNSECNPNAVAFTMKLAKLYKDYKEYSTEADRAESNMNIYNSSLGFYDAFDKQQHQKYKAEMEKAQRKTAVAKEEIFKLYKDNEKIFQDINAGKHEFIGWRAIYSYRAETAGGLKTMGGALFFLNRDLTEITHRFSEDDMMLISSAGIEDIQYELGDELKDFFADNN
ncbi:MAG: hypothetical protein IJV10_04025 [Prevotella sp.]|nr:hypothetical protein [Prevotella sp.]MBR1840351.1 hypothetical protein [Prevotella sp.]